MPISGDDEGWIRWLLGGIASFFLMMFGMLHRHAHSRIDDVEEDVKDHGARLAAQERDTGVLEAHSKNASRERTEIKQSIEKLGDKIDTLTDHLIPRK